MCVVSMVGDHYADKWREWGQPVIPIWPPQPFMPTPSPVIDPVDFEKLKQDVLEMKELLKKAKAYDEAKGEPDCEIAEKLAILRKVAELVGVPLDDVLRPRP